MTSWSYWLWAIMAQVHGMLKSTFRERRGVVTLLGVPPAVGFALLDYFSRPRPGQGGRKYNEDHPSYKQGTSAGKVYHFIKFAYDCMADVEWAFPLGDLYHKTCADAARLVTRGRFSDLRLWATPVQFKYKWAVQRHLGAPTMGVHTFSVSANVTHIGLEDGQPRFNMEYGRWVAEQQQEQIDAVKRAIKKFPSRPLRANHSLAGVQHRLLDWAQQPTPLPHAVAAPVAVAAATEYNGSDDEDEADDGVSSLSDGSDSSCS